MIVPVIAGVDAAEGTFLGALGDLIYSPKNSVSDKNETASPEATKSQPHSRQLAHDSSPHLTLASSSAQHTPQQGQSAHTDTQAADAAGTHASQQGTADLGITLTQCALLNASVCGETVTKTAKREGFAVVVYNSVAWPRQELVRVPIRYEASQSWEMTGEHWIPALCK